MRMRLAPGQSRFDILSNLEGSLEPLIRGFSRGYTGPDRVGHVVAQIRDTLGPAAIDEKYITHIVERSTSKPPAEIMPEPHRAPKGVFTALINKLAEESGSIEDDFTAPFGAPRSTEVINDFDDTTHYTYEDAAPLPKLEEKSPEFTLMMTSLDSVLSNAGLRLAPDGLFYPLNGFTWMRSDEYFNFAVRPRQAEDAEPQGKAAPHLNKPLNAPEVKAQRFATAPTEPAIPVPTALKRPKAAAFHEAPTFIQQVKSPEAPVVPPVEIAAKWLNNKSAYAGARLYTQAPQLLEQAKKKLGYFRERASDVFWEKVDHTLEYLDKTLPQPDRATDIDIFTLAVKGGIKLAKWVDKGFNKLKDAIVQKIAGAQKRRSESLEI